MKELLLTCLVVCGMIFLGCDSDQTERRGENLSRFSSNPNLRAPEQNQEEDASNSNQGVEEEAAALVDDHEETMVDGEVLGE